MNVILCKGRFAGPISGADETLVAYATQMKAAGHDVSVAVLLPFSADDRYYRRLRVGGVPVSCIAQTSLFGSAIQLLRKKVPHLPARSRRILQKAAGRAAMSYLETCRRYFERQRPDVVHVVTPDPAAMVMIRAARAAGIAVLYQELGTPEFLPELTVYYEQLRDVLPLCDGIAALSPSLAGRFSERFAGSSPASVLPLMVDDVPSAEPASRSSHNVTFGFAARMEYGKGPLLLVDAFVRLSRQVETACLRMAGEGPQAAEVEMLVKAAGLDGHCALLKTYSGPEARSAFMRSIDVFVLPTLADGTPNGIIEAMASGLPVIASAVGGIPDVVSPAAGILVTPGDAMALADAMMQLATDSRRRAEMGRAARLRYEQIFSPAAVLPLLTDRYERVAMRQRTSDFDRPRHPWAAP